jgi:hypothetical protein
VDAASLVNLVKKADQENPEYQVVQEPQEILDFLEHLLWKFVK